MGKKIQVQKMEVLNLPKMEVLNLTRLFWGRIHTAYIGDHMCQGLNSHYFHIIGDGHQPNSRGLYTHNYKDSLLKVGGLPSPIKRNF